MNKIIYKTINTDTFYKRFAGLKWYGNLLYKLIKKE